MELIVEDVGFVTLAAASGADAMLVRDGRITAIGPPPPCAPRQNLAPPRCGWAAPL